MPQTGSEHEQAGSLRRGVSLLVTAVSNHPVPFTIALIGSIIYGTSVVIGAIVVGAAIDDLIIPVFVDQKEATPASVMRVVWLLIGFAALRIVSVTIRRFYAVIAHARMKVDLRCSLTDHFLRAPLQFHREKSPGELLSSVDNDVQVAAEALSPLPNTLGILMMALVGIIRLVTLDSTMLLVALTMFPVLAFANHFYTRLVEHPAALVQHEIAGVAATVHESFDGAMIVKTLGREQAEINRLDAKAQQLRISRTRVGALRAGYEPALELVPIAGTIVVLAIGVWRIGIGSLTPGEVVEVMTLFTLMAFPLQIAGHLLQELPVSVAAMDRITSLIEEADNQQPVSGTGLPVGALPLRLDGVSFAYGDHEVLRHLDLEISKGEVVALVGSTGGGKSTMFDLITRLVQPDDGALVLADQALNSVSANALTDRTARVFQETFLFADTIQENITLGRPINESDYRLALSTACINEFLSLLPDGDLSEVGERGVTLSGGQRQRIAIARALVKQPGLLLLDDATSAIDPATEAEILSNLNHDLEATTLIVAHRLSTIRLASRVLFLVDGKLCGDGSHLELMDDPNYAALVNAYEREPGVVPESEHG